MSGFALIYSRHEPDINAEHLRDLVDTVAWRGPDQQGTWCDDHIGLGAVQLYTTKEDRGSKQPAVDHDTGCALVLDGRLDNRAELGSDLNLTSEALRKTSDAALALAAYRRWGSEFVRRMVGPFSLAVWDGNLSRLLCARDPLGQRPFFYRLRNGYLSAASTIEALQQIPGIVTTINEDYLWDFLCTGTMVGSFDPEATPYSEIRRIPAGHILTVGPNYERLERYWEPWALPPLTYVDDRDYADHFRELFTNVVRSQLRSAGPVTATLSGGLDSSSIVCVARHLERMGESTGGPLHTLTLTWPDPTGAREGYDEQLYVDEVVRLHPGPTHSLAGETLHGFDLFRTSVVPRDEPRLYLGQLWEAMARETTAIGSQVLLSGDGGDHLLTGNLLYLADLLRAGAFRELVQELRRRVQRQGVSYPMLIGGAVLAPTLPRHLGHRLRRLLTHESDLGRVDSLYYWHVAPWVQDRSRQLRRGARRHRLVPRRFASFAAQKDYEQLALGAQDHARMYLYNLALAAGVDLRSPFFDRRLVDFCLRLPPHLKRRDGLTKVVLREGLRDVLPEKLVGRRDKTGYDFAVADQIRRNWAVLEQVYGRAESERLGYVNAAQFLEELAKVRQGGGGGLHHPSIVAALGLEDWLRAQDPARSRDEHRQEEVKP